MTERTPQASELRLQHRLQRAEATAVAARLLLAQRTWERDQARAWARAAVSRDWPRDLDRQSPPRWLRTRPAPGRTARLYGPAFVGHYSDAQRLAEVAALIADLKSMLRGLEATPRRARGVNFYVTWLNVLLVQVRALLALLDEE